MRRPLALVSLLLACTPVGPPEEAPRKEARSFEASTITLARSAYLQDVVQIESADAGTCALTSAGAVFCWGLVARSDDGPPYVPLFGRYQPRPVEVAAGGGAPLTRIAMGRYALAAVDASGRLLTAGDFGLPVVADDAEAPTDTPFVRASRAAELTLQDPQRIFLKLGREHLYARRLVPTELENVTTVAASGPDLCWIGSDLVVHCNGGEPSFIGSSKVYDPGHQLIDPHAPTCIATGTHLDCDAEAPRDLFAAPRRIEAAGRWETCILLADRSLRCKNLVAPGPFIDIALAIHRGEVCAARGRNGRVSCYSLTGESRPAFVPGTAGVVELVAGTQHLCGRRNDGMVVCWGRGEGGRLGRGTSIADEHRVAAPVVAPGPAGASLEPAPKSRGM